MVKALDTFKAKNFKTGSFSTLKLKKIAKQNNISTNKIIEAVGEPETVKKIFYDRTIFVAERRCKICRKVFSSKSKTREVCYDKDCMEIYEKQKREEDNKLRDFKRKLAAFLLQEIQAKKEAHAKKMRDAWNRQTPEEKAIRLQKLQETRRNRRPVSELSEEELAQRAERRKKRMEKKKLMKSAFLQILNTTDEGSGVSNLMAVTQAVVNRVKRTGDPRAAEFIRNTIDEDPKAEEKTTNNMVIFASPPELVNKFGDEVQNAEYIEVSEKEQYERLKNKYENKQLEDKSEKELIKEIKSL